MSDYKCPCGNLLCPDPGIRDIESKLQAAKEGLEYIVANACCHEDKYGPCENIANAKRALAALEGKE